MTWSIIFLVFIAMIFYGTGEYCSKLYATSPSAKFAILALSSYLINAALFLPALERWNSLALLGTIWNMGYCFITLFLAVVIFKETISTIQYIGIFFGLISIFLLSK